MGAYRTALTKGFLFKFLVSCSLKLSMETCKDQFDWLGDAERSAVCPQQHVPAHSVQFHADAVPDAIVGQPLKHRAADLQVFFFALSSPNFCVHIKLIVMHVYVCLEV
jgi:hypothetical protein